MIKGIVDKMDWQYLGAMFASQDSEKQTEFFKGMIKEMLSWGTIYQVHKQLSEINSKLTDEEKEVISMLGYREAYDE